jgi:hypothetical protein
MTDGVCHAPSLETFDEGCHFNRMPRSLRRAQQKMVEP